MKIVDVKNIEKSSISSCTKQRLVQINANNELFLKKCILQQTSNRVTRDKLENKATKSLTL